MLRAESLQAAATSSSNSARPLPASAHRPSHSRVVSFTHEAVTGAGLGESLSNRLSPLSSLRRPASAATTPVYLPPLPSPHSQQQHQQSAAAQYWPGAHHSHLSMHASATPTLDLPRIKSEPTDSPPRTTAPLPRSNPSMTSNRRRRRSCSDDDAQGEPDEGMLVEQDIAESSTAVAVPASRPVKQGPIRKAQSSLPLSSSTYPPTTASSSSIAAAPSKRRKVTSSSSAKTRHIEPLHLINSNHAPSTASGLANNNLLVVNGHGAVDPSPVSPIVMGFDAASALQDPSKANQVRLLPLVFSCTIILMCDLRSEKA